MIVALATKELFVPPSEARGMEQSVYKTEVSSTQFDYRLSQSFDIAVVGEGA